MRTWAIATAAVLGTLSPTARAAQPLSLADALSAAASGNTDLRVAELSVIQADASLLQARSSGDPTLGLSGTRSHSESQSFLGGYPLSADADSYAGDLSVSGTLAAGTTWTAEAGVSRDITTTITELGGIASDPVTQDYASGNISLTVTQDLLVLLRDTPTQIAIREAAQQHSRSQLSALQVRQQALTDTASAWWSWKSAVDQLALAEADLASAAALSERTAALREVGQVNDIEVAQVTAERLQAERDRLQARQAARRAADALLLLIGSETGQDIVPAGTGSLAPPPLGLEAHLALAEEGSISLALAALDTADAEADLKDARAVRLPSLDLTGQVARRSLEESTADAFAALTDDRGFPSYTVGLSVSTPLGGRSARAGQQQAEAALTAAELQQQQARQQLHSSVSLAVQDIAVAEASVALARARLDAAQRAEDGEAARLDAGQRRLDQLIDARDTRQAAALDVQLAEQALAEAHISLAQLQGRVDRVVDWVAP